MSNPKVNRGCAPLTANRTSADCVQISLGPSIPYIPLGVYRTGRFNAMLTRYAKLRVAHAPGMLGTFPPTPTSKETACWRSRHASRHVRHARAVMHVGIANPRWRGKRSRHSRRMRNPQICVSGKRSIQTSIHPQICRHKILNVLHCAAVCALNKCNVINKSQEISNNIYRITIPYLYLFSSTWSCMRSTDRSS